MKNNTESKFFLGSVKKCASDKKEWFFGNFMTEPLLQFSLVEVAWQHVSDKKPVLKDKHFHKQAIEITIIIKGGATFFANGERQNATAGDFWVVYPQTIIEEFATERNTELIVIKAPSVQGDKYTV